MKNNKTSRKLPAVLRWVLWVLLVQLVLVNISAALYAYKFTHLREGVAPENLYPKNVLAKTWRLFSGPDQYKSSRKEAPLFPYTTLHLKTKSGVSLEAWYSAADSFSKGTVILFHAYSQNKSTILNQASEFRSMGYGVMLLDARGHGNSGKTVSTIGYAEAEEVRLAYEYVKHRGESTIFLWGLSMGAVQIIKAVGDYDLHPAGIIVEAPFKSLQSHIKGRARTMGFPQQPFSFFVSFWVGLENGFNGFGFDVSKYAKKIDCPVLLQYGSKDQYVEKSEIDRIYNNVPSANKELVLYEDAYHEQLLHNDPVLWRRKVEEFLRRAK